MQHLLKEQGARVKSLCVCVSRINLWLIFSETFAAAAGGGETCLMCNQRDVFLPAGSRPSVRRHMMHVLHLPNLPFAHC